MYLEIIVLKHATAATKYPSIVNNVYFVNSKSSIIVLYNINPAKYVSPLNISRWYSLSTNNKCAPAQAKNVISFIYIYSKTSIAPNKYIPDIIVYNDQPFFLYRYHA